TWSQRPVETAAALTGVAFAGKEQVIACGANGTILRSRDGGKTWQQTESYVKADLVAVFFRDERRGWIVGGDGIVLSTGNGGEWWLPVSVKT
ncbi:YCF48-related protein, partial [Acinetobacter baumannii]